MLEFGLPAAYYPDPKVRRKCAGEANESTEGAEQLEENTNCG